MPRDILRSHHLMSPEQVYARAEALLKRSHWYTGARLITQEYEDARRGMPPFQDNETNMLNTVREVNKHSSHRHSGGGGLLDINDIRTTRLYVTNYALFAQLVCRRARYLGLWAEPTPAGWSLAQGGPGPTITTPPQEAPHLAALARLLQTLEGVERPDAYFATICGLETV